MAERKFLGNCSFEQILKKYADTVTGVCIMRLKNFTDTEDCFQNVFYKLYYKSPEFDSEEHLKAWLIRIAINECTSFQRKKNRQITSDLLHKDAVSYDNTESMDISWAMMQVPEKYRDLLYLHYCQNYKVKEISQILKIKENTVKSLLKRGREILKSVYGGIE